MMLVVVGVVCDICFGPKDDKYTMYTLIDPAFYYLAQIVCYVIHDFFW
jgi:hypothetical protein